MKKSRDPADLGLAAAARAVHDNQLTAAALTEACLARIDVRQSDIGALAAWDADQARKRAYVADRRPADKRGFLHGIPLLAAPMIDVSGTVCDRGSAVYADRIAAADAALIGEARAAGGIVLGVASGAEFSSFGSSAVLNPHDGTRSPGDSGAAAAVAAGMAPLAFDARVDGPLVRPAACCGVYGLTPTRHALKPEGVLSLAPSLETRGLYLRDAEDVGFACRHFLGTQALPGTRADLAVGTEGLTVLLLEGPSSYRIGAPGRSAVNRAAAMLADGRVETARFSLPPQFVKAEPCYETILSYEIAQRLARGRDRLGDRLQLETLAVIDRGRRISASVYEQARHDAMALRRELLDRMGGDTVFLDAAMEGLAPPSGDASGSPILQALWAIAGTPVLAVPCGVWDGLPVGIQIAAAPGREDLLARLACIIEDGIARLEG